MKRLRFRAGEVPPSELPEANLLPGLGREAREKRQRRQQTLVLTGLFLLLLALLVWGLTAR